MGIAFSLLGGFFGFVTWRRSLLDYNEQGRYFDPAASVVYDTDALIAYGCLAGLFLVVGLIFLLSAASAIWKRTD